MDLKLRAQTALLHSTVYQSHNRLLLLSFLHCGLMPSIETYHSPHLLPFAYLRVEVVYSLRTPTFLHRRNIDRNAVHAHIFSFFNFRNFLVPFTANRSHRLPTLVFSMLYTVLFRVFAPSAHGIVALCACAALTVTLIQVPVCTQGMLTVLPMLCYRKRSTNSVSCSLLRLAPQCPHSLIINKCA